MPNFMKISCNISKFSILKLDSDGSVCMVAICYCSLISAILTNMHTLEKKKTCAEFQIVNLKTMELFHA